jgi:hypothetical protein
VHVIVNHFFVFHGEVKSLFSGRFFLARALTILNKTARRFLVESAAAKRLDTDGGVRKDCTP